MYEIKKVNILSVAKITSLIAVIIGIVPVLAIFLPMFLLSLIGGGMSMMRGVVVSPFAVLFIPLILPLLLGVAGFIQGLIGAFVYNLISEHITGGVEMEIVLKDEPEDK